MNPSFASTRGGLERGLHIGIQRCLVANHFQLDPVGESDLARQARRADRVIGRIAAGGIGQKKVFVRVDVIEQRFLAAVEIHAAHGHGHHVGAAGLERARGLLK